MKFSDWIWLAIGVLAAAAAGWKLYDQLRKLSFSELYDSLAAIPPHHWLLAAGGAALAYAALTWYDRIALLHLRKKVPMLFVGLASFTAYALAHNIGASVLSGAIIRYRAYSSQGLSAAEVGVLVGFCSFTFLLGTVVVGTFVLLFEPEVVERFFPGTPRAVTLATGTALLFLAATYVAGSWRGFRPLRIGGFEVHYPRLPLVARQLMAGPLEMLGAASIIYFALPEAGNPGFLVVLGIFLVSFSAALLSHAPGGLGVLEVVFLAGLSDMAPADVLAALLVFRLFYLLVPLALSLGFVVAFEHSQLARRWSPRPVDDGRT